MQATPGKVLITGHTDNQPIRTAALPVELASVAGRAPTSVADAARQRRSSRERMRAEGRADAEPVDRPTTRPPGRARNRRVEITLIVRRRVNTP